MAENRVDDLQVDIEELRSHLSAANLVFEKVKQGWLRRAARGAALTDVPVTQVEQFSEALTALGAKLAAAVTDIDLFISFFEGMQKREG